ncbi:MAG TPA: biotin/lipoyl-containing protein, partial [Sphingomicrobium sp.]|nr:biotin/lipoyl-containing protein [Sphingomicrobium sp.]
MATDVQVPALGESITEGTLAQWLKKPGDAVAADEPIASLETDKVTVEVPSPVAGRFGEALVKEGDTVAVGTVIARIEEGAEAAAAPAAAPAGSPAAEAADATTNPAGAGETPTLRGDDHAPEPGRRASASDTPPAEAPAGDTIVTLSPAVRRAVLEHHVDPSKIRGTGKDGRLTKDDVIAAAEAQKGQVGSPAPQAKAPSPPPPAQPKALASASAGERKEERVPMSRLRKTIAARLKEAQNSA